MASETWEMVRCSRSSRVGRPKASEAGAEYSSSARASPMRPRASSHSSSLPTENLVEALLGHGQRGEGGTREQPVPQEEVEHAARFDHALGEAEVGLVAATGAKEHHQAAIGDVLERE